jgi:hypothetical protein
MPLSQFFAVSNAYSIPPYQRTYSWEAKQWQGLVRDITELATNPRSPNHFFGIMLYAVGEGGASNKKTHWDVLDGQQRILTIHAWVKALADHAAAIGNPNLEYAEHDVRSSEVDRPGFEAVNGAPAAWEATLRKGDGMLFPVLDAYHYFRWVLWLGLDACLSDEPVPCPNRKKDWKAATSGGYAKVFEDFRDRQIKAKMKTLKETKDDADQLPSVFINQKPVEPKNLLKATYDQLFVISIMWQEKQDEDQSTIYETLNGSRVELSPLDHVKNRLFLDLGDRAVAVYTSVYQAPETRVEQSRFQHLRAKPATQFLYDFLIAEGSPSPSKAHLAAQFQAWGRKQSWLGSPDRAEAFISGRLAPSMWAWVALATGATHVGMSQRLIPDALKERLESARVFSIATDPILLLVLRDFASGKMSEEQALEAVVAVDTFLARNLLIGTSLFSLRSKIMGALAGSGGEMTATQIRDALANLVDLSDEVVRGEARTLPVYERWAGSRSLGLLRGIEHADGVGGNPLQAKQPGSGKGAGYTVEHIAPQELSQWEPDLRRWGVRRVEMEKVIDRLGNLTAATGDMQGKVKNYPFADKKATQQGDGAPQLGLNKSWLSEGKWTPSEIADRTDVLITRALKRWPVDGWTFPSKR